MRKVNAGARIAQAARRCADEYQARRAAQPVEYLREVEDLTLAQVLLADGEAQAARLILEPLLARAQAAGRKRVCLEAALLLARLSQAEGDPAAALDWLGLALRLAAPEGYARIFLDEGRPLLDLLPRARQAAPEFVASLLTMAQPGRPPRPTLLEELPDPLSEQELRVLQLIVAGKSNREIAAEVVISLGTAKWHVHNVLQKLGVSSRAQAIARARRNYHLADGPARNVIVGASLGGLMAAFIGLRDADLFGNVLAQSAYFGWRPKDEWEGMWIARQFIASPLLPLRFYIEAGLLETDIQTIEPGWNNFLLAARYMRDVLRAKGYTVHHAEFTGGHNPMNWRSTLADGLLALLGE